MRMRSEIHRHSTRSPLELEEVVFGIRCLPAVRHAVVKAMQGRGRDIKFFQIHQVPGRFELQRHELDESELDGHPRRALSKLEGLEDLT